MATYNMILKTQYAESGDDLYAKPIDGNLSGTNWPDDSVAFIEIANTNSYEADLDETKGYLPYVNTHAQVFTVNPGTDVITANSHGLLDGYTLRFKGSDLPAPLVQTTIYFVRDVTANTFKVAATSGGTAIDITDAGSGVMTFTAPSKRSIDDIDLTPIPQIRDATLSAEGEASLIAAIEASQVGIDAANAFAQSQTNNAVLASYAAPISTASSQSTAAAASAATAATKATEAANQTTLSALKAGGRAALSGRWENLGTGINRDDILVGDIP